MARRMESTCQQFEYWQQAKQNVTQTFFDTKPEPQATNNHDSAKDPTAYK